MTPFDFACIFCLHFQDCQLESNFRGDDDATFEGNNSDGNSHLVLLDPLGSASCGQVGVGWVSDLLGRLSGLSDPVCGSTGQDDSSRPLSFGLGDRPLLLPAQSPSPL